MKHVLLMGGDPRTLHLFYLLSENGCPVRSYGIMVDEPTRTVQECLAWADILVLPVPSVIDDPPAIKLCTTDEHLPLSELGEMLRSDHMVVASMPEGSGCKAMHELCEKVGCKLVNLLVCESFKASNAIPTAEGALDVVLRNGRRTIHGSSCLVVGYGQVGKALAQELHVLGAHVTVSARRSEQLEEITQKGYKSVHSQQLSTILPSQHFIFNTVPHCLMGEKELRLMRRDAKIIELASIPYGFDREAAMRLNIQAEILPGIPGKMYPESAAEAIFRELQTLVNT